MKLKGLIFLLLLVLPMVSSTLVIQDTFDKKYNVGDPIEVNFSVQRALDLSGFVEAVLTCDGKDFVLKKDYIHVEANKKKTFYFESPLSLSGDCRVRVLFLNEEEASPVFEVSDHLNIDYFLSDKFLSPGESIFVNGSVKKENGRVFDGTLDFTFDGEDPVAVEVKNGNFSFSYRLGDDLAPGNHTIYLVAEERDAWDMILNKGERRDMIYVKSKPSSLEINSSESIVPPANLSFTIFLYNQVNESLGNASVVVKILNPSGDVVLQGEYPVGEIVNFTFPGDAMKGGWAIFAYYEDLMSVYPVYVGENKKIESFVEGNVFKFKNVGNVQYGGVVKFTISNGTLDKDYYLNVSIPIGQTYEYPVYYVGDYNVSVGEENLGLVHLTGMAILEKGSVGWKDYSIFAGALLFLILVGFFILRKKPSKKDSSKGEVFSGEAVVKKVEPKKILVKEKEEEEVTSVLRKTYILFFESQADPEVFRSIIENYGFKMNRVSEKVGYTLFYEKKGVNSELKLYNLAKAIKRFSDVKKVKTSIVINRGKFESKVNLLKKFALLNRSLLKFVDGKILMTRKFYESLGIKVPVEQKEVEVLDRKLKICLI